MSSQNEQKKCLHVNMSSVRMRGIMPNTLYVERARRRISQMKLARAVGIPFYRYWKIENDYLEPSPADRERLAAYFRMPEAEIFFPAAPPADAAHDADAPL